VAGLKKKMTHLPGMSAEEVARIAVDGIGGSRALRVTGVLNQAIAVLCRHLPLTLTARLCRGALRRDVPPAGPIADRAGAAKN
jgi:hypothetical protein